MLPCELSEVWPVIVAMAAILAASCVPLAMFLRDRQLYLGQRHAERMKALEMGSTIAALDPPREQAAFISNAFWIAFWMGLGCQLPRPRLPHGLRGQLMGWGMFWRFGSAWPRSASPEWFVRP